MEDRTELICYITRQDKTEEYKVSLPDADYGIQDFIESFVKPIMLAQGYHADSVKEAFEKEER